MKSSTCVAGEKTMPMRELFRWLDRGSKVATLAWRGVAWRGVAWRGVAWRGVA
jgi:hypothetical protein